MSTEPLLPIYLLAGTDRPKHVRALARLRTRFGDESVELLAADSSSGEDAVGACNALGLFATDGGRLVVVHGVERWRKADIDAVGAYLQAAGPGGGARPRRRGGAEDGSREPVQHGQVLQFDVPKPANLHAWVRSEFERLGARADPDAARALVEICGEDVIALSSEIDKIISWAGGDAITAATSSSWRSEAARLPPGP